MRKILRRELLYNIILQFLIIITEFILYNKITLLNYINISFYLSSLLLFSALFIFVIQKGFFDVPAKAFTILSSRNDEHKTMDETRPLSKLISLNHRPLFLYGLLIGAGMLIALAFYYN